SGRRRSTSSRRPPTGAKTSPTCSKASWSSTDSVAMFWIVAGLVAVALVFDYINGFHDAANSIATVVSTRVLSPGKAVIWAAVFNFIAAFVFGTAVAQTVGAGMIDIRIVTFGVIFGGLVGAIVWDLITWYYGLPTSSSHALIGGYAGAAGARGPSVRPILPGGGAQERIFLVGPPLVRPARGPRPV